MVHRRRVPPRCCAVPVSLNARYHSLHLGQHHIPEVPIRCSPVDTADEVRPIERPLVSTFRSGTRLRGRAGGGKPLRTCPPPVGYHRVWPVIASGQCGKEGPARLDVCRRGVIGRGPAAQYRKEVELQSKGQELRGQELRAPADGEGPITGGITDPACIGPRR